MIAIPLALAVFSGATPATASAITRATVIKRAHSWITRRVKYSQSAYYHGYRRDCSGFVSMAWKLKHSYTSSTIRSRARRISWRSLKLGDAVRRAGHVEIFGGWKNRGKRRYWALEESTRGKPALKAVKTFKRGYSALRLRGITEVAPRPIRPPAPKLPVLPKPPAIIVPLPTQDATSSVLTTTVIMQPLIR